MAEENSIEEQQDFNVDVSAFTKEEAPQQQEGNQEEQQESSNTFVEENNDLSWEDIANGNVPEPGEEFSRQEQTEEVEESSNVVVEEQQQQQQEETKPIEITDEIFGRVSEELGLKAKNLKELKEVLQNLERENQELKSLKENSVENEKIASLKKFNSLSDEALLLESFKRQGFSEEEAQNAVDRYADNQMLDIEAKKIRKGIDNAIAKEQQSHIQNSQQEEARLQKEREESVNSLKEYINGVDTMFGLKIAKSDEEMSTVRKEHIKYITSGTFLNEVTESNENLVEASWLWKNKDILTKSFYKKGKNEERKEFLDELTNPDISGGSNRLKGPNDEDGFNVSKFITN